MDSMAEFCLGRPTFLPLRARRNLWHPLTSWPVTFPSILILASLAWLAWAWLSARLLENPRGDVEMGIAFAVGRIYARLWHHLRVDGREHIPSSREPGPLIVVANHTAGVDPFLIQVAVPFEVRWMMARDMMAPILDGVWTWADVIAVDRSGKDTTSARQAIAHVRAGKVLGVFPEGRLERPQRHLLPFLPGLGLIVKRTGARVLPVIIEGTPQVDPAWASVCYSSRSSLRFLPVIDYASTSMSPAEIVEDLRGRFAAATQWPTFESPDFEAAMRE
jgi:1-acyl-sn-glycerol-3-phosphate acyltransferase